MQLVGIIEVSFFARNLMTESLLIDPQARIFGSSHLDYSQLGFAGTAALVV
ncbi:hypothetical protein [Undibacterium sp. Di24W]|uniref:hypothetical protein n=1 Tax=Undibacterium sp. Di24W TaxID=3413033 RepID=UPI003BF3692F